MLVRRESNRMRDYTKYSSTSFNMFLVLFRLLTSHIIPAENFSDSIPLSECSPMESIHGVEPQQGPHPFTTYADKREITNNGEVVELALTINQSSFGLDVSFKGFLVMAFGNESDASYVPIGSFMLPSNGKVVSCPNGLTLNNAVTHESSNDKQFVTVSWTPPKDYVGSVNFRTTYLRNGTVFWINTPAAYPVRVNNLITTTLATTTDIPSLTTSLWTYTSDSETTSDEGGSSETTTEEMSFNVTDDGSNFTNIFTTDMATTSVTTGIISTTRPSGGGPSSGFRMDFNVWLASLTFWVVLRLCDKRKLLILV